MKAIGMVRKIDSLGRIVIPMEMFIGEQNQIVIKKYVPGCQECGTVGETLFGKQVKLCQTCINVLKNRL